MIQEKNMDLFKMCELEQEKSWHVDCYQLTGKA